MAYKGTGRVASKKDSGDSAGRKKAPERRWRLVDDDFVSHSRQSESLTKLSHDIRTQLYIIIGYAELMLEEIPGKINDAQRHNLNDVLNSGKRLQAMLEEIVDQPGNRSGKTGKSHVSRGVK